MQGKIEYRGLGETMRKLFTVVLHSTKTLHELFATFIITVAVLLANFIPYVNVYNGETDYVSLFMTFIGLGVTVSAVFMTDIDKLDDFFESCRKEDNKFRGELLSLSIFSVLIPIIGIIPNIIKIEGFHILSFYDAKYWNIFFAILSTIWLVHTIIHVLSLKINNHNKTQ